MALSVALSMNAICTRQAAIKILLQFKNHHAHISEQLRRYASQKNIHFPLLQKLVKGSAKYWPSISSKVNCDLELIKSELDKSSYAALVLAYYQLLYFEKKDLALVSSETLTCITPKCRKLYGKQIQLALANLGQQHRHLKPTHNIEDIAQHLSHPQWLIEMLINDIGLDQTIAFCEANNRDWPLTIRANTHHSSLGALRSDLNDLRIQTSNGKYLHDVLSIIKMPRGLRLQQIPGFNSGAFQVQDESACLVSEILNPKPGEFIIDMCAAPGGKCTHLAQKMKNRGKILAVDLNADKLNFIKQNLKRQKISIIELKCADSCNFSPTVLGDRVLLDAPCSGLGTLGRKVEVRWTKTPQQVAELCDLQKRLLTNAAKILKVGGFLVYSTCTVLKQENEQQIEWFLNQFKNFSVANLPKQFPKALVTEAGFVRTWPHLHSIGGSFAALLRKNA